MSLVQLFRLNSGLTKEPTCRSPLSISVQFSISILCESVLLIIVEAILYKSSDIERYYCSTKLLTIDSTVERARLLVHTRVAFFGTSNEG